MLFDERPLLLELDEDDDPALFVLVSVNPVTGILGSIKAESDCVIVSYCVLYKLLDVFFTILERDWISLVGKNKRATVLK